MKIRKASQTLVEKLGDSITKVDVQGKAQYQYCNDLVKYGNRGGTALVEHTKG